MSMFARRNEALSQPQSLGELNDRLAELKSQLEAIPEALKELSRQRQSGELSDRDYNLRTSSLTLLEQNIPREIALVRKRIDSVTRDMARSALGTAIIEH